MQKFQLRMIVQTTARNQLCKCPRCSGEGACLQVEGLYCYAHRTSNECRMLPARATIAVSLE